MLRLGVRTNVHGMCMCFNSVYLPRYLKFSPFCFSFSECSSVIEGRRFSIPPIQTRGRLVLFFTPGCDALYRGREPQGRKSTSLGTRGVLLAHGATAALGRALSWKAAMAAAAECSAISQMPCLFVLALGRTGSTHLLRLLNSIPGYRISGETDNAWIHMGWFAELMQLQTPPRNRGRRQPASLIGADDGNLTLCSVRRLMLQVHNPSPGARVFGFKEIYSPFVRRPAVFDQVFSQGISFIRMLFPRAKFIFHWRSNLTRIADSDFWKEDRRRNSSAVNFEKVVARYRDYASAHGDHAYTTTIETINKKRSQQLTGLFRFLGEELTPELRRVASARLALRDWTVQTETRRFKNGTKRSYSFTTEAATRAETVVQRKARWPKNRFKNGTKRSYSITAETATQAGTVVSQRKLRSPKSCSSTACSAKRVGHALHIATHKRSISTVKHR